MLTELEWNPIMPRLHNQQSCLRQGIEHPSVWTRDLCAERVEPCSSLMALDVSNVFSELSRHVQRNASVAQHDSTR